LLKYMIMYDRPLYCTITIDDSQVSIKGMKADYQTITPEDAAIGNTWNGVPLRPAISDYTFPIRKSLKNPRQPPLCHRLSGSFLFHSIFLFNL